MSKFKHCVLYTSSEVRSAITELFRDPRAQRIAISAFVGDGAEAYLPYPKGLRLICSPTPGGTNPTTLRQLMSRGVSVEFVDSLHMKVYWAKGRGAVITSANLSTNALGIGALKEAGILIGPDELDVERLIKLKSRPAMPELHILDRKHKEYYRRNRWSGPKRIRQPYVDWYASPARPEWKIFFWHIDSGQLSESTLKNIEREYGKEPHQWIWSKHGTIQETDWVLCVYTGENPPTLGWLFVDRVFRVADPDYPFEVIQVGPAKWYPPAPFTIDQRFRKGLTNAVTELGQMETETPLPPTSKLLDELYLHCKEKR